MAFRIRCPGCRQAFPWDAAMALPERCPLPGCDYEAPKRDNTDENGELVISAPFIGTFRGKGPDACYRELETSSEARAQMAADVAGVPVSEMSHMKVTNIRDARHQGEIAAVPVVNEVTKQMDYVKQRGGQVGFQGQQVDTGTATGAITVNGQTIQGIQPRAGVRAMDSLQARFNR